jgi:hypothetical protein
MHYVFIPPLRKQTTCSALAILCDRCTQQSRYIVSQNAHHTPPPCVCEFDEIEWEDVTPIMN